MNRVQPTTRVVLDMVDEFIDTMTRVEAMMT